MEKNLVSIFGHLLMQIMRLNPEALTAFAQELTLGGLTLAVIHDLLAMTIFAKLEAVTITLVSGTLLIQSGMVRGVGGLAPAVSSTLLHGSARTFPNPPLTT